LTIQGQAFEGSVSDQASLPIEIAFLLRHGVSGFALHEAAESAGTIGCSADEALIKLGFVEAEAYYRALAIELGLAFLGGDFAVASGTRFPDGILVGLARLGERDDGLRCALAPCGQRVAWMLTRERPFGCDLAITSPSALARAVLHARADAVAALAANELAEAEPHRSYRGAITGAQKAAAMLGATLLVAAAWLAPIATFASLTVLSGLIFFGMVVVRIAAAREPIPTKPRRRHERAPERALPVWTVIVPMRREGRVLARLIGSLEALDYPRPKLQTVLVTESDDREMAAALSEIRLPSHFEVVVAPPGKPQTKPRALNVVLPLARGEFLTVYDAEDVPDPDQLRLAAATFARSAPEVACLQARLVIDNTDDNWMTRLFTIEYATLFDVINPASPRSTCRSRWGEHRITSAPKSSGNCMAGTHGT
jgi:hypothetical protein